MSRIPSFWGVVRDGEKGAAWPGGANSRSRPDGPLAWPTALDGNSTACTAISMAVLASLVFPAVCPSPSYFASQGVARRRVREQLPLDFLRIARNRPPVLIHGGLFPNRSTKLLWIYAPDNQELTSMSVLCDIDVSASSRRAGFGSRRGRFPRDG